MAEKKKTVGQMLYETEEAHRKAFADPIEVGEFVEEIGNKEVMKEIWKQIDARTDLPQWKEKYYILLYFKKNSTLHRVLEAYVQCRHTEPKMEDGLTCFSYDPIKGEKGLNLEWVLPHRRAFSNFLRNRNKYDPFLIECIEKYQSVLKR